MNLLIFKINKIVRFYFFKITFATIFSQTVGECSLHFVNRFFPLLWDPFSDLVMGGSPVIRVGFFFLSSTYFSISGSKGIKSPEIMSSSSFLSLKVFDYGQNLSFSSSDLSRSRWYSLLLEYNNRRLKSFYNSRVVVSV